MRIMVADDQPDVRSALRLMLEQKPGITQVLEVSTAHEMILGLKSCCPDLVLMDWELPGTRPDELIKILRRLCSGAKLIALSSRPQMKQIALDYGADSFVCKSDPPETLLSALEEVDLRFDELT
jgi:DNA-binding NarL/FixJ family response regulator